jgi:hypothetical protein
MVSVRYCLGRDFQPAAASAAYFGFGELEEALIHGGGAASAGGGVDPGVIIKNDVAQAKCKCFFFCLLRLPSVSGVRPDWATCQKGSRSILARLRTGTAPHRASRRDMPRLLCSCRFPFLCKHSVHSMQCDADATQTWNPLFADCVHSLLAPLVSHGERERERREMHEQGRHRRHSVSPPC